MKFRILIPMWVFILLLPLSSQAKEKSRTKKGILLVEQGKPKGRILHDSSDKTAVEAARILNSFLYEISGATLPVSGELSSVRKGDVILGLKHLPKQALVDKITEDGFAIYTDTKKQALYLGGEDKGTLYAVITLLEDYLGVRYLKEYSYTLQHRKNIVIPFISRQENPSFRYRQTQAYSTRDPLYKLWHRIEEPKEVFAGGYWVHTFNKLLPASQYGKEHPEYYAFMNGQRHPGDVSQWCLTNEDVFDIVAARVDSIFRANPNEEIISVSQNDSQIYCRCSNCQAILDREGSPSGPIIYFLNKLATKFPDKEFSTLAYLFSVPAPKHIKPLPNVNIMLCDIDAYREVPLTDNKSGQEFVKELIAWSKITSNIFVWDYGINFDNYVAPFPNFHILKPNMQLFKKYGATMHFSQIAGSKGGDFSELRSYLVSKLLWNVEADEEEVIQQFLIDFYGEEAAPYLYDYIKLRTDAMLTSKIPLWIYDTPVTHKEGMLNRRMISEYYHLFDQAEKAVSSSPIYLDRVREERLPIQYAELEILRTESGVDKSNLKEKVAMFRERAREYNVTHLNERSNTIESYCQQYLERNIPSERTNLALGAEVEFTIEPNNPYNQLKETLTDGLYGGATFNDGWVGWEGRDGQFVIDLGARKSFTTIQLDFLHKLGSWVLMPHKVTVQVSEDGDEYVIFSTLVIEEDRDVEVKFNTYLLKGSEVNSRYIKINVEGIGLCPHWHYGVGNPAWFFIDEVEVF